MWNYRIGLRIFRRLGIHETVHDFLPHNAFQRHFIIQFQQEVVVFPNCKSNKRQQKIHPCCNTRLHQAPRMLTKLDCSVFWQTPEIVFIPLLAIGLKEETNGIIWRTFEYRSAFVFGIIESRPSKSSEMQISKAMWLVDLVKGFYVSHRVYKLDNKRMKKYNHDGRQTYVQRRWWGLQSSSHPPA